MNGDAIGLEGNGRIARHIEDALAQHRALDLGGDVSGRLAFPVTVSALASNCNGRETAGSRWISEDAARNARSGNFMIVPGEREQARATDLHDDARRRRVDAKLLIRLCSDGQAGGRQDDHAL